MSKRFQISAPVSQCPKFTKETIKKKRKRSRRYRKKKEMDKKQKEKKRKNDTKRRKLTKRKMANLSYSCHRIGKVRIFGVQFLAINWRSSSRWTYYVFILSEKISLQAGGSLRKGWLGSKRRPKNVEKRSVYTEQ